MCSENQLSELSLLATLKLVTLQCYKNQLSALDVSMLNELDSDSRCGDQQPDKMLTLRLTSAQNSKWRDFDTRPQNARIKKVITD